MTVYEAVWALIRDALFQEKIDYSEHYQDIEFWTSVYAELQSQLAIGLTSIVASKHEEIPSDIRQRWINEQREYVGNYYHMLAVEQEACALLHEADIMFLTIVLKLFTFLSVWIKLYLCNSLNLFNKTDIVNFISKILKTFIGFKALLVSRIPLNKCLSTKKKFFFNFSV